MSTSSPPLSPPLTVGREELLTEGTDRTFRQMIQDLITLSVNVQRVRDEMAARIGISGPQYAILMRVAHFSGPKEISTGVTVKETAAHLHVSGAFVTGEVKKLMSQGLLKKTTDAEDRRKVRLRLSPEGRARLEAIAPMLRDVNDAFFGSLSAKDFQALTAIAAGLAARSGAAMDLLELPRNIEIARPG